MRRVEVVGLSCDMGVTKLLRVLTRGAVGAPSTTKEETGLRPSILLRRLVFSDGTSVELEPGDVVLIVGPNNAGKSEALRGIEKKLESSKNASPVVQGVEFERKGSVAEVMSWLKRMTSIVTNYEGDKLGIFGKVIYPSSVGLYWDGADGIGQLAPFFCALLTAEERLKAANAPDNIAITEKSPSHPIHILQWDDSQESRISEHFEKAFGTGIVIHRNAGGEGSHLGRERAAASAGRGSTKHRISPRTREIAAN